MSGAALETLARKLDMEVAGDPAALVAPLRPARARADALHARSDARRSPSIDWLTQWGRTTRAQLNAEDDAARRYRRAARAEAGDAAARGRAHRARRHAREAPPRGVLRVGRVRAHRRARRSTAGMLGPGAYVVSGDQRQEIGELPRTRSTGCSIRRGAGQLDPALQGPRRDEPGAALGHDDQSATRAPACRCGSRTPSPPTTSSPR